MRLSSTSEEQKVHQQIATLAHDSVSTVASAAFVAFAKVADILQLEEEEDEDDEDDKGEGVPKIKKEGQKNDKRPLSRQFHWTLNQHAMEIISKEELDSIYRLFRFYDSSSYGDKLPSMSKNMFLQLLRDASMFDPPDFTEETAERIFAEAILGQLRTYLDADGNPALTFQLFCGSLLNCGLIKFPQMEPSMALSQVVLLCLSAQLPSMITPVTDMMMSSVVIATTPSTTTTATSAVPSSHEGTHDLHSKRPRSVMGKPLTPPNFTPPVVDTHKSLVYELAANDKSPIDWSTIGESVDDESQNDFRNESVFQQVFKNLLKDQQVSNAIVDLDQLYTIPEDLKLCFPPNTVDLITEKFKVFDSAETGHIDKEEWYAMLSGVIDFTDIFDVIKLLEEQNTANHSNPQSLTNTPIDRISLSDLFEALYACPRTRIKLEFGSGMYQNRGQARAALIQKRAKQSEEKEKQVAKEREQANIQSHLPSIHPSNPLNTSNPDSTVTNSTSFTPNVNANVNTSKSIIGNRKRGKQKSMSIAAPVNTSSSFSAGYDRESTISELTEVKTSDLGFSSPPTSSSSRSSNTAEELNVSENRGRHVSTGEKNAEIKEAAAAAAAATLHATSLEMSSLSSSFPFFVSQSAILPISNVNSPRNNDPSPLETIHPDTTSRNNTPSSINPQSTRDEPRTATKTPRVVMILGENNDGSIYWEIQLKEDNSCIAFFLLENSGIHYKTRNEIFEQTKGNDVYVNFSLGLKSLRKRVEQKIKEEGFHVVEGQEYLQDPPQGQFAQQLSGEASKVSASRRRQTSKRNSYVSSTSRISMRVQNEARSLERAGTIVRASATSMAFLSMLNERLMFKRYKEQCMLNSLGTSTKDQQSLFASMNCEDGPQNPQTSTSRSNNPYPQRHTSTVVETALQGMASNLSLNHARVFAKRLSIQKPLPELPPNYKELSSISEQNDTSWIQELSRVRLDQSTTLTSSPTYSSFIRRKNSTVNVAFGTTLERKQTRVFTKMDTFSGQKQVDHKKRQSNFSSSSSSSTSQLPTVQKRPSSLAPLNS